MQVYVSQPSCWAPGLASPEDWMAWAEGKKQIACTAESPALSFASPLFRRRLSQLSKMTVQVVHDALLQTGCGDIKLVFVSLRGELNREFSINEKLIEEGEVSPAAFSLSVFNAPVALATICSSLKSGYSVIFPAREQFAQGFAAACAPVLCGAEKQVLFVYGDELVPEQYASLRPANAEPPANNEPPALYEPLAFAAVISAEPPETSGLPVPAACISCGSEADASPAALLRCLLKETCR